MKEQIKKYGLWIFWAGLLIILGAAFFFVKKDTVSEEKALELLESGIRCEEEVLSFTIPQEYADAKAWNILVSGRQEFPDGMSMSTHLFEEENSNKSWEKGKTYSIPLKGQHFTELNMDIFLKDKAERHIDLLSYIKGEEAKALTSVQFPTEQGAPLDFQVTGVFPASWVTKPYQEEFPMPGDFLRMLSVYDGDTLIAVMGYNYFEPVEEETAPEEYYKAVYSSLRLSRFFGWDPYQAVKNTGNKETGIADIWFLDLKEIDNYLGNLPDCPTIETKGILSYDKERKVYIGIAFVPEQVKNVDINALAETVEITGA